VDVRIITATNRNLPKLIGDGAFREDFYYRINVIPIHMVREKITSQNWRSDLVQVWVIRESKTTGIASYFEAFESEVSAKYGLKLRC